MLPISAVCQFDVACNKPWSVRVTPFDSFYHLFHFHSFCSIFGLIYTFTKFIIQYFIISFKIYNFNYFIQIITTIQAFFPPLKLWQPEVSIYSRLFYRLLLSVTYFQLYSLTIKFCNNIYQKSINNLYHSLIFYKVVTYFIGKLFL